MELYAVLDVGSRYGSPEVSVKYMGTDLDTALVKFRECFKDIAWDERKGRFKQTNGFFDLASEIEGGKEKLIGQFDEVFDMLVADVVSGNQNDMVSFDQEWCEDYDEPFKYVLVKRIEG